MYNELERLCSSGEFCSLYCDGDLEKFYYGKIIAVNEMEIALQMVSPNGALDGIIALFTDSICKIEVGGLYDKKMKRLFNFFEVPQTVEKIDSADIFTSILEHIVSEKKLASIELMDSGSNDVVGFVSEFDGEACRVNQVDEYGNPDGKAVFCFDNISQIVFDSMTERNLTALYKKALSEE